MVDNVSIINGCIALVGGEPVANLPANLNDAKVAGRTRWAVRLYPTVLESTLSLWAWNDARRRRIAGKAGEAPAFGFSARYALEQDELKVCAVMNCGRRWMREGRFILMDGGDTLPIMTINRVAATELNAVTAELVSARLAHRVSVALSDSAAKQEQLKGHVRDQLLEALQADAWEGSAEQLMSSGWWLATQTSYRPELEALGENPRSWLEAFA